MTGALFPATSMPDRDWWEALWSEPAGVLRQLCISPQMTVIDLCCGDGYFTAPLAKLVEGKLYALDLDPAMIEKAKEEVSRQDASVLRWFNADAREIAELAPERVDYVLMANTFHGVPDHPGLVRAVRAILCPNGLFGIVNWHPLPREKTPVLGRPRGPATKMRMAPEAVAAIVKPEGFRRVDCVQLPPYHYGIVFERRG